MCRRLFELKRQMWNVSTRRRQRGDLKGKRNRHVGAPYLEQGARAKDMDARLLSLIDQEFREKRVKWSTRDSA